ncbi:hypothetical protein MTO96_020786 [Rhipicephalus appendiculatus]
MASASSYFSGSNINYLEPCTSSEGIVCDIFRHLLLWNEFFWQERVHEAATLLHHLLTLHHCVVSVSLNEYIFVGHVQLICDTLCTSPSLRKLKISMEHMKIQTSHSVAATLPYLNHLRELNFSLVNLDQTLLESLSHFLASTTSLKTFLMGHLDSSCKDVVVFLRGLEQNATITELSFRSCLLRPIPHRCGPIFADYLRESKILDTLTMLSCNPYDFGDVCLIVGALLANNTLSKLKLFTFGLDDENIQSISRLLCGNQTLKAFNLIDCFLYEDAQPLNAGAYMQHTANFGSVSSRILPWLVALTENKTLIELSLDLSWFSRNECKSLFKVIASHESLCKVYGHLVRKNDMAAIFEALRNVGWQERFSFYVQHVFQHNVVALTTCERMWRVVVNSYDLGGWESLHSLLGVLSSCKHVTSLTLVLRPQQFSDTTSSFIATYLTSTTALRELQLCFVDFVTWHAFDRPERALVQALSVNKTLYELSIQGLCFDETETRILADMMSSNRTIIFLVFYPDDPRSVISLVQKLSLNFSKNYAALGMRVTRCVELGSDWFTVAGVVQRNNSLATRASHFVMGTEHKYCAVAFELVHFTPGLVAKVKRLASVDENEAELRIKRSLRSISELDVFMRISGVVKNSVTCQTRDDGQVQLVNLNRECWLHIRQYIRMDDILDEQ